MGICVRRASPRSRDQDDHGYREAKAVLAFSGHDVAEVSKERHEILHKILPAQITDSEAFRSLFTEVYRQAHGERAAEVIVLADGARWIWTMVEDLLPHAVQILDFQSCQTISVGGRQDHLWRGLSLRHPVGEGTRNLTTRRPSAAGHCSSPGFPGHSAGPGSYSPLL